MVWIFFLSINLNYLQRNQLSASTLGPEPHRYSFYLFPNRVFWNFSHKPLFHNAISYSVRHSIIRSFPNLLQLPLLDFFPINKPELLAKESTIRNLPLDRTRIEFLLSFFQIESFGVFRTSHFSTMLYHIVSDT